MPLKFNWTHAQDTRIRRLRGEGSTWDAVATSLGLSRGSVIERGRRIGARPRPPEFVPPPDDLARGPLPAGHSRTWGAMNAGTVLADEPYPQPEGPTDPISRSRNRSRQRRLHS
jgi:hypothetical protein